MQRLRIAFFAGIVMCAVWPSPVEAVLSRTRIPLSGRLKNLYAKGFATYTDSFLEKNIPDGKRLLIVVENISLPPDTVLLVFIHDTQVGTLTLNKQRAGRFEIVTDSKTRVPSLTLSSTVDLKLADGSNVMW